MYNGSNYNQGNNVFFKNKNDLFDFLDQSSAKTFL